VRRLPGPWLFGGAAFRPGGADGEAWRGFGDARFVVPRWCYLVRGDTAVVRTCSTDPPCSPAADPPSPRTSHERPGLDLDGWRALVDEALAELDAGRLRKVVAARRTVWRGRAPIDPARVLARLGERHTDCTRFAVGCGDAVFLGATPERLVVRRGLSVVADALAGTAPPEGQPTVKDHREHAPVIAEIVASLAPFCTAVTPGPTRIRLLRDVQHLWTPIAGALTAPTHVVELAAALHPTPAVCGVPRAAALAFIDAHEPDPRGWYAGPVGWFDAAGEGAFAVAIRSAVVRGTEAWLHAGAGLVPGSDAELEWRETTWKLAAVGGALEAA